MLYEYDQFHTTLEGLSSACAKSEPPSSKSIDKCPAEIYMACSLGKTGIKLGQIWEQQQRF